MNQVSIHSNDLSTDALFSLIESKLHLLTEMQEMSIAQSDFVAQHDMSSLMSLLSRKQELMESLKEVQSRLEPFQPQDPEQRIWPNSARRKTCQSMIERCNQLLQQMIVMENRSLDNMTLQREIVAAQLQQNINATTLQNAYQASDMEELMVEGSFSIEG